jgi:endoglucanase
MAQNQFLLYLSSGNTDRIDEIVYGRDARRVRGQARQDLKVRARREVGKNPYAWLQRVPERYREKARLILKLARNPQTFRVGGWTRNVGWKVRRSLQQMETDSPGALAFLYVYRFPHKHCGNSNAGGPRDWAAYRRWIAAVARGIGNHHVAVFLEPDGVGTTACLTRRAVRARWHLYRFGIGRLARDPNATIYLDGGHSHWYKPGQKARMLRRAGVMDPRVRGFFLNSTGYNPNREEVAYGNRVSRLLGGKHFVVSTAVNGNGPYRVRRKRYAAEQTCNPPGRALGSEPTVHTASPFADAYVWIGDPGRSGGCRHRGQPRPAPPNEWWEWYALQLAKRAHWQ